MKKVICVIGTRPEAIKMAPLIHELRLQAWANVKVLATAQHRQLLDQVNQFFGIRPDIDLDIMRERQTLTLLTANLLTKVDVFLESEKPDLVLVQGDTTTVMAVSLACFYRNIPIGHVEAGLRTGDIRNPFPEEANRCIVGRLATWHFAPTEQAKSNLIREGIDENRILVSGNTVIDALLYAVKKDVKLNYESNTDKKIILVTSHRRENFGKPLEEISSAVATLAKKYRDYQFVFPVHPNPNVRETVYRFLGAESNISLIQPLEYPQFVHLMKNSFVILTDSGGVQEEAPALGKPVLVLRDETERPEAVAAGVVKIVGPHSDKIITEASMLLDDSEYYKSMARGVSPYGDGHASERICCFLRDKILQ